jgi:hypothetical protein
MVKHSGSGRLFPFSGVDRLHNPIISVPCCKETHLRIHACLPVQFHAAAVHEMTGSVGVARTMAAAKRRPSARPAWDDETPAPLPLGRLLDRVSCLEFSGLPMHCACSIAVDRRIPFH